MKPFERTWETIVFVIMMLFLISSMATALWVLLTIFSGGLL